MNETLQVIAARYACRDFTGEMVEEASLRAIARAAVEAPSALNRQPWRVVVVKDRELMGEMEAEGMRQLAAMEDSSGYGRIMSRGGRLFYGAPCMMVIPVEAALGGSGLLDCGILCQNIALAATSLKVDNVICGMAGLALTGGPRAEAFQKRLQFPKGYVFGCAVLLGYGRQGKAPHAPDLEKIVFVE